MELNLEDIESDFLCRLCGNPLYVYLGSNLEACLEASCPNYPAGFGRKADTSESGSPVLHREIAKHLTDINNAIKACNIGALRSYAYEERLKLEESMVRNGAMPIDKWMRIGELLLLTNKLGPTRLHTSGTERIEAFEKILGNLSELIPHLNLLEDIETGRYQMLRLSNGVIDRQPFILKYMEVLKDEHLASGLVSKVDDTKNSEVFKYSRIEEKATIQAEPDTLHWEKRLAEFWSMTIKLRHMLRMNARTAKQYDYKPTIVDMTIFIGWFENLGRVSPTGRGHMSITLENDELKRINTIFNSYANATRNADKFVGEYIDSQELVPIVVRTPDKWLMDTSTLLFFMILLQGAQSLADEKPLQEESLDRWRKRAANEFENHLRSELNGLKFTGPDEAIKPTKQAYEYDILKVSEEKRLIVLADAKFRDISPSSFTGENLVPQELTNDNAMLDEADRQVRRLEYFNKNIEQFRKYLNPKRPWNDYGIRSLLVTKYRPVIKRYKNTEILSVDEFLASI